MSENKARVIAMYLPQYYPITENDKVWGKGYTEWSCVAKARPLFRGHYQPRYPADLGFYDLRVPEVREQQAEMARYAGIEGFMYWHYWMGNGKRLLERPFDEVLSSGKPDFPFCLAWANHSWRTSTWTTVGRFQKNETIVEQTYPGDEDIIMHFNNVLPAFRDHRYIKVDKKPLFLIYDPLNIPNIQHLFDIWKNLAKENGLEGVHFVGLTSGWENTFQDVLDLGVDAIVLGTQWIAQTASQGGRVSMLLKRHLRHFLPEGMYLEKYSYSDIVKNMKCSYDKLENAYPQIIPNWDRSPRSGKRASIYYGSTPELFQQHVSEVLETIKHKTEDHRIMILRSWNEWGEGNYMEPDSKYGWEYLDALRNVILG